MNRRNFLSLFGVAATGIILPEPRRVYSFPSFEYLAYLQFEKKLKEDIDKMWNDERVMLGPKIPHTDQGISQIKEAIQKTIKVYDVDNVEISFGGIQIKGFVHV